MVLAAESDAYLRHVSLIAGLISPRQALDMPGGPIVLFQESQGCIGFLVPYFFDALRALEGGWPAFSEAAIVSDLAAFGEYLIDNPELPWLRGKVGVLKDYPYYDDEFTLPAGRRPQLSESAYLGAAAVLLIMEETGQLAAGRPRKLGPLRHIEAYPERRQRRRGRRTELPGLRVPNEFKPMFRDWAEGQVNFTAPGLQQVL
jgi:hypothetical protein